MPSFVLLNQNTTFIYATPVPMIVCLGVNDVLFGHKVRDTTPVFPGSIWILFLTVNGIKIY